MSEPTDLPRYENTQFENPTLECDAIMKGGVTSGIVYPYAILEIATRYRFRSLGGTSAGAIAAAFAAAAEYSGSVARALSAPLMVSRFSHFRAGGAEGNRTPDLCSAIAALSHLSYSPAPQPWPPGAMRIGPLGSGSLAAISHPCNRLSRRTFGPPIGIINNAIHQERRSPPIRFLSRLGRHSTGRFQAAGGR